MFAKIWNYCLDHSFFLLLMLVLWHALIFTFSQIPDLQSGLPAFWDFFLRKYAHATEFGVLAWLWLMMLHQISQPVSNSRTRRSITYMSVVTAGGLALLWAIFDEYHQTFVPGRYGSPVDVMIDTLGIMLGLFIVTTLLRNKQPRVIAQKHKS
jgi:VanZ family protein